jgi:hypothetical protein
VAASGCHSQIKVRASCVLNAFIPDLSKENLGLQILCQFLFAPPVPFPFPMASWQAFCATPGRNTVAWQAHGRYVSSQVSYL